MNLALAFEASASRHSAKSALFWGDEVYAYEDLSQASTRLSQHLVGAMGVRPGDRVAVWLRNRPEFVLALFGVLKAGAVVVPINNFLKAPEVSYILGDAGIDLIITERERGEEVKELKQARPSLEDWVVEDMPVVEGAQYGGDFSGAGRTQSDLAVIIYTSGTTGRPKGAMLSHGNLLANVESCRQVLAAVDADRFVVLLPMFHSFMLCVGIFLPLLVGGSMVVIKSLHPPKNVLLDIIRHQATILPAIPQFFRTLATAAIPESLPLRVCVSGAAPLPVEVLREFTRKMTAPLIEGYGLSEASPVVSMNPLRGPHKEGSIGLPIPGVEMSVRNEAGEALPVGEIGEICVRGDNVMQGYWNLPEATEQALKDGWLYTGDVGYRDADGYYFITDRKKDMLLVNGINVYPREIEELLYQMAGVKEASVVGTPDIRKGEQPVAFVALNEGSHLDEKAIVTFLKGKLADYKVPRRVFFLPALPRNATGKVLKTALREQVPQLLKPHSGAETSS